MPYLAAPGVAGVVLLVERGGSAGVPCFSSVGGRPGPPPPPPPRRLPG